MTTSPTQGEHAQPEALRLADALASNYFDGKQGRDVWDAAAAELRRLHAQVAALTAAQGVPRVELELPMGDSRTARAVFSEMKGDTLHICITVDDATAQPAAPQGGAYAELPYKQVLWSKNCMQCCVAYMMGLPLESVPDFAAAGGWQLFSDFVESRGYAAVMLPGNHEFEADYLASGTTARGTSHMVVMNDGKLVHDPHPSNSGLLEVQCVWLLAKRASPTSGQQDEHAAFEASAKAYTSNVSFARDGDDYEDMTASLLWHGWKLRAPMGKHQPGRRIERTYFPNSPAHRALSAFCHAMHDQNIDGADMRAAMLWFLGLEEVEEQVSTPQADSQPAPANTRQIAECYGDCPTDPKTCANPCKFEGRAARTPADSVTAPAEWESEDVRRARHIAAVAQRWIGDRTHLGALVYLDDLAWALKTLAAAPTPAAQGDALDRVTNFRHEAEGMVRGGEWVRLSDVRAALAQKEGNV